MPSRFAELTAKYLGSHTDHFYGARITLTRMKTPPNGRAAPDPERPVVEGVAPYHDDPVDLGIQTGDRRLNFQTNDLRTIRTVNQPMLSVDLKYFPLISNRPRQGDAVELEFGKFDVVLPSRTGRDGLICSWLRGGQIRSESRRV